MAIRLAIAGKDGDKYVPMAERTGEVSVVQFTRDLSAAGLRKAAAKVLSPITGKQAVKLHTGEKDGPNIIPRLWVRELVEKGSPEAAIIETNTYDAGDRDTTEKHRVTISHNGWTFCPVDITDEDGSVYLPVVGGKWFDTMAVGGHLTYMKELGMGNDRYVLTDLDNDEAEIDALGCVCDLRPFEG